MTDRIDFGGAPWQAIPRDTLRDPRLGAKAKGGLVTLLSHDEGWVRSAVATLQRECNIGRAQAQSIMRELRDLGYATLVNDRTLDGRIQSHYVVHAIPKPAGSSTQTSESPVAGKPARRETRPPGNQAAVVEALDVEPTTEEPKVLAEPSLGSRANALATLYHEKQPMSRFPAVAGIARTAIKAGYPDAEIAAALLRLADEGRSVTIESLRIELDGLPHRRKQESAPARIMRLAQGMRS